MADEDHPQGQTPAGGEGLVQESTDLRWEGHRLQGAHIELSLRFEDTTRTLESKGDREARAAMLRLAKEFKQLNDGLAAKLARISMINRTLVEILRKSEDGQAALMMRKAAELLVKGLANAEEEVFSLKAKAGELERQRDHYKALLARTNSELDVSRAHAQISEALGGEPAGSSSSGGGGAGDGDDATIRRSARKGGGGTAAAGGKGKAPARRSQRRRPGDGAEARATSGGDGDGGSAGDSPSVAAAAAAAAENDDGGGGNSRGSSTVWRGARIAVPGGGGAVADRGSSRKREARPPAAAAAAAATIGSGVAAASAAASTRPGSNKRPREAMETATDARGRDRPGSVVGGDNTKDVEEEEEGGRQGEGGDGVSSAAEGGIGRRQSDSVGDSGGGGADGSDGGGGSGDPESDYNSDDAPSMFF